MARKTNWPASITAQTDFLYKADPEEFKTLFAWINHNRRIYDDETLGECLRQLSECWGTVDNWREWLDERLPKGGDER